MSDEPSIGERPRDRRAALDEFELLGAPAKRLDDLCRPLGLAVGTPGRTSVIATGPGSTRCSNRFLVTAGGRPGR
jgi:hypothetical protein